MKIFSFNLLPEKSKEEIQREEKRDSASLYTALLPFGAALIWLTLTLVNGTLVGNMKSSWQSSINDKQIIIDTTYRDTRLKHGELVIKSRILGDFIEKDIQPEILFKLIEDIFPIDDSNIDLIGYGRTDSDKYSVTIRGADNKYLNSIVRDFNQYPGTDYTTIESQSEKDGISTITVSFVVDIDYLQTQLDLGVAAYEFEDSISLNNTSNERK